MTLTRVPDLDSLELLLLVATTGSMGKAGRAHGISQPAVTARVRAMEALVGVPLVSRGPQGSTLTTAGSLVADWAREVLAAAAVLDAGIASLRSEADRHLDVAASLTVAEHLLPRWLVALASTHADVVVRLAAMNSVDVATAVLDGAADVGFVEGPTVPAGLASRTIAHDRLVVVVPPRHPWTRRRRPVPADELAGTRLVQREPSSGSRTSLEAALREHVPLASPLLELSTGSAVRAAVLEGAGPAVLSILAVQDDVRAGRLVAVPVSGVDLTRRLRAVWRRGQRPTGAAADLLVIAGRGSRE